jgi:hypothetical protein
MHPERWTRELEAATTEMEIVYAARDFSAMLSRAEISRLPESCRPPLIRDADDISSWGIETLRAKLAICPDTDHVALILSVEAFLSAAMHRLAQIEALSSEDPPLEASPRQLDS